jgi:hypothetical protein
MKKISIFIILLLFGFTISFAQEADQKATGKTEAGEMKWDPKLSPEEIAIMETAGEDNPAKINPEMLADPKENPEELPTEEDFGEANAKPDEVKMREPVLDKSSNETLREANSNPTPNATKTESQPEGNKEGVIVNYSELPPGPDEQEPGETPENIPNIREMKGPDTQPEGDAPDKL